MKRVKRSHQNVLRNNVEKRAVLEKGCELSDKPNDSLLDSFISLSSRFSGIMGKTDSALSVDLFLQALQGSYTKEDLASPEGLEFNYSLLKQFFMGIEPKDEIESMLAGQIATLHNTAMRLMAKAGNEEFSMLVRDSRIVLAVKLMRAFREHTEALNRYRGKGQQKVVVEHVTVNHGGQAIVGVMEPGGAREKK